MKIETPEKFNYNPELALTRENQQNKQKSFQTAIHDILDFKNLYPDVTKRELIIFTKGILIGKNNSKFRKII